MSLNDWMLLLSSKEFIWSAIIILSGLVLFLNLKTAFQRLSDRVGMPKLAVTPVILLLRFCIPLVVVVMVMKTFGMEVDSLLGVMATAAGLLAIGFVAVWSVLSNFLCTFVLILFKPFSVGDELEFPADSVRGKVVDLTLLFTTLRTSEGDFFQIPNNMFFQKMFRKRIGAGAVPLEEQLRAHNPVE